MFLLFALFIFSQIHFKNPLNYYFNPRISLFIDLFVSLLTKSSKAFSEVSIICFFIKGTASRAPCSELLIKHSHSRMAQPSYPLSVSNVKIFLKSTWPSPRERKRPARSFQSA